MHQNEPYVILNNVNVDFENHFYRNVQKKPFISTESKEM